MNGPSALPRGFEDLEPFVEQWALEDFQARNEHRFAAGMAQVQAFYDAVAPRAPAILDHLDPLPLDALSPDEKRLYQLLMAVAHCALSVEFHGQLAPPNSTYNPAVRIVKGPSPP
ncbi:hypothetical protein Sj15T_38380 [Sphingobium sp. TA15]|uniref:Uncharacterized protein n=1 Tax=Sphingobium indicum (strain DSM 16413 / CCM 7287 / MTCC 6362 / UT26 / NBRC 101211 / UT26S) TaxID=452662 RepID=D4Z8F1_SPHIU|nr:hypothetical protein [Sphingobium indicum]BAI98770.1 hypothetical protein SJA_C2-04070 [Sphingobium indicum UT26S]BDD68817.1 hypothetical protein Sj15T_38380 [Sphingobium sp. TA15]